MTARDAEAGRDGGQREKHERAAVHGGVRKREFAGAADRGAVCQEIEVDHARTLGLRPRTAHRGFDAEEGAEKGFGRQRRADDGGGVQEIGLRGAHRAGFHEGRAGDEARAGEEGERGQGAFEVGGPVAEVGAEGDCGAGQARRSSGGEAPGIREGAAAVGDGGLRKSHMTGPERA